MKRLFSISVLLQLVTSVMTVALVLACAIYAQSATQAQEAARRVPTIIDISNDLLGAIQTLRLERGNVVASLVTPGVAILDTQNEIADLRQRYRKAMDLALEKSASIGMSGYETLVEDLRLRSGEFQALRQEVDAALQMPQAKRPPDLGTRWVAAYNRLADSIERLSSLLENELGQSDAFIADMVRIKQTAWTLRTDTGRDRFRLAIKIAGGKPLTQAELLADAALNGRIDGVWKLIEDRTAVTAMPPELIQAIASAKTLYFTDLRRVHNAVIADLAAGKPMSMTAPQWMTFATPGQESIVKIGNTALTIARQYAYEQFATAQRRFYTAIGLMVLFLAMGVLTSLYVFHRVARPISMIADTMRALSDGNLAREIPYGHRNDEIGDLAHGLRIFRDNAIEKQRLRIEKDGAEAASRAKSEFLANVSHELRTPLNAVLGFSEAMKTEIFGSLSERYRGYAADIFNSGTHLLGLINEILDLSKLEAGRLELHDETINLAATLQACINLVEKQAEQSLVTLSVALDRDRLYLRADDRRFRQILINLLSNAVKFTPAGGRVRIRSYLKDEGLAIEIADTGIGIAAEDLAKVLMPFGQVDSKISRKHEGTGLGLPLAKHLIDLHGGTMSIKSTVNAGTTISFVLPKNRIVEKPPLTVAAAGAA
jgi:signal transduction histidine kinase